VPIASLLAIGNELLNGEVRDANLFTLSRELTHVGFTVTYAGLVRDDPACIAELLHFLLAASPDVLICSGGLGPTADDLTLAALADALQRPLTFNSQARNLIETQYAQLLGHGYLHEPGPEEARRKMATLPAGAQPLPNPIGTAPGVRIIHTTTLLYVLPGVPAELEAIFAESILPELHARFALGVWTERALLIHCDDEATAAPMLREVARRHPEVYLKSLAQPFPSAGKEGLRVIAAICAADAAQAQQAVTQTMTDLQQLVEAAGLRVTILSTEAAE
jgi:molybdenum cofactor synthesis domain-containing protein